jgi:YD repeat-containing protein
LPEVAWPVGYDGLNRRTDEWQHPWAVPRPTTVVEPTGNTRVSTYGALDRLETTTYVMQEKPFGVVEYAYDPKGNRARVTDPEGVATSYGYDAQDRLTVVTTPRGPIAYGYWPDGLRKRTTFPNGLEESRCYDAAGQVTAIVTRAGAVSDACPDTAQDVSRFRYGYDLNGNRTFQREWRTDPATQVLGLVEETTYGYDGEDRLVGVQYPGGKAELYRLDAVGNRTGERELAGVSLSGAQLLSFEPPAGATVVRDVAGEFNRADWLTRLTDAKDPARTVTLAWTASGELKRKTTASTTREHLWDGRGALVAVEEDGTRVGTYDYEASGLRVKRSTATEGVEYVLDEKHVLQEADGRIAEHPGYRRYHYGAEPVAVVDGATASFIGTDALGSPTD